MTTKQRTWLVQRSWHDETGWRVENHCFGPSESPPAEAVIFLRRAHDDPTAWAPITADEVDVTGDWEIRQAAGLERVDAVPCPPHIRDAVQRLSDRMRYPWRVKQPEAAEIVAAALATDRDDALNGASAAEEALRVADGWLASDA